MIWKPSHLTREQMEERRLTGGRMLRRTLIAYRASRDNGMTAMNDSAATIFVLAIAQHERM